MYDDIYQSNPPLQFISESAEFQFNTTVAQLKESENNVDVVKMMQQAPLWHNQERKKQMWRGQIKPNTLV